MKKKKSVILLFLVIISVSNCLYKTFRPDKIVQWDVREKINKKVEVNISNEAKTDTRYGPLDSFVEIFPISNKTKKKYLEIINKILIESNVFSGRNDSLKVDLNHSIKRDSESMANVLLTFVTLMLYPVTLDEKHQIEIKISQNDTILFEKQSEEVVQFRFSFWFVFLFNFFNNADVRDRIFYEHSSLLIKDFYNVYDPVNAKQKPGKVTGKKNE